MYLDFCLLYCTCIIPIILISYFKSSSRKPGGHWSFTLYTVWGDLNSKFRDAMYQCRYNRYVRGLTRDAYSYISSRCISLFIYFTLNRIVLDWLVRKQRLCLYNGVSARQCAVYAYYIFVWQNY